MTAPTPFVGPGRGRRPGPAPMTWRQRRPLGPRSGRTGQLKNLLARMHGPQLRRDKTVGWKPDGRRDRITVRFALGELAERL